MLAKIARAVGGILKLLGGFVRIAPALLAQRRQAVASFRNHLKSQGLAKETVNKLTKGFKDLCKPIDLLTMLKDFNPPHGSKRIGASYQKFKGFL